MNRYLVFCLEQEQWDAFVKTHDICLKESLIHTMETKEHSFILTDKRDGTQHVYLKMLPDREYRKSIPITYQLFGDKIWLCSKSSWLAKCFEESL